MIKRYRHLGAVIYVHTQVASNTLASSTASTATYTTIISGEAGAVVTFQVTVYSHTAGGASYSIDGTIHIAGDTITRTLDGSGHVTLVQFLDVGTLTAGNMVIANLLITNTTIGIVDPISNLTSITKST